MNEQTYTDADRRGTLLMVRIIWFGLVMGQVAFGFVAVLRVLNMEAGQQNQLQIQMLAIAIGVLIGAVGIGYFARNQAYKRHWQGHAVTPAGFFMGNLILLALLETASFVSLVMVMLGGQVFPMVLPAVASLAIQCANFPSGMPMQQSPPDFAQNGP